MMPWKDDIVRPLDRFGPEPDRIRMRFNIERGVMVDFVVQPEAIESEADPDAGYVVVVRYDGSHGRAHQDILDGAGRTVRKIWLPDHLTMSDAFQSALDDLETNWRRYHDDFRRRSK
jgi:bifunctional DNA-binding transcriptional regulator/antitoxin component of YhaV-PrlF toxin-antitoxin module